MSLIIPANTLAASGYAVDNSCRFNGTNDSLNLTTGTPTDAKKFTFSTWLKKCKNGVEQDLMAYNPSGNAESMIRIDDSDRFVINDRDASDTDVEFFLVSNAVLRDPSAWYNLIVAVDTTDGTNTNRVKMYINGTQVTSLQTATYPDQNITPEISAGSRAVYVGARVTSQFFNGYLAETVFIDGQQLAADSFGEFDEDSGIWKPIDVSGLTFGNNGFYFEYSDSSDLGVNSKGTDWTPNNLAAVDQSTDTCTNNFATLNSIDTFYVDGTLSEGNCKYVGSAGNYDFVYSTIQVSQGKWYFEGTYKDGDSDGGLIGITGKAMTDTANYLGKTATHEFSYIGSAGRTVTGGTFSTDGSYDAFTADDVIGVAMDLDNNKLYYSKNGTFQNSGDPTSGATGTGALAITAAASTTNGSYAFAVSSFDSDDADEWEVNFGNPVAALSSAATDGNGYGSFEYAPPSGYLALCTKNLATDG